MEEKISGTQSVETLAKLTSSPESDKAPKSGKEKPWLKIVLLSVLGLSIVGGLVFAGSKFGQREIGQKYQVEEYCVKAEMSEKMSLSEAKKIARNSECTKEGSLKEEYFCNENTGTWWIDLDIEKEGCNPACVVNVSTKKAEINWRCTGLISQ